MINYSVNNKHRVIDCVLTAEYIMSCGLPLFKYFVWQLVAYVNQSNYDFSGYSPSMPIHGARILAAFRKWTYNNKLTNSQQWLMSEQHIQSTQSHRLHAHEIVFIKYLLPTNNRRNFHLIFFLLSLFCLSWAFPLNRRFSRPVPISFLFIFLKFLCFYSVYHSWDSFHHCSSLAPRLTSSIL